MLKRKLRFMAVTICLILSVGGGVYTKLEEEVKAIRFVPTTHKVIALTIDDGPYFQTTPGIHQVLREKGIKATFFTMGLNAEKHPELLAKAVADGHEIGLHGYTHKLFTRLSEAEITEEMDRIDKLVASVAPPATLFRPPGGAYNAQILDMARRRGLQTIMWNIDTRDWARPGVDSVVNNVMKNVRPGSIILMHDGQYPLPTAEAIGIIIDRLKAQGYQFVTVSELLQYYEVRR